MQLPFSILVKAPRWAHPRTAVHTWWIWVVAAGILVTAGWALVLFQGRAPNLDKTGAATLQVTSVPPGAALEIDGRGRGHTPATLPLSPGEHRVRLSHQGYADATHRLRLEADQTSRLDAELWLQTPRVQPIRPTFPGASIEQASFLNDGRVALLVALPPGDEKQLWLVDGGGGLQRLGPPRTSGSLAFAPDGERIAYLAQGQASSGNAGRPDEVWLAGSSGEQPAPSFRLPAGAGAERLVDLSWAPDAQHLLVVSQEQVTAGGIRTHLRVGAAGGEFRELVSLPSEIVPGSYTWSPDGRQVAFLARAGQLTSICLVGTRQGEFRYLADLSRDDPNPLPFTPVAWSPDGRRLVYAALTPDRSSQRGWPFGPAATLTLFTADPAQPLGERVGDHPGHSPIWRSDGSLIALARPKTTGPLVLQEFVAHDKPREVAELPLKPGSTFAARWDVAHGQALVATRGAAGLDGGRPGYWLVRFREEGGSSSTQPEAAR